MSLSFPAWLVTVVFVVASALVSRLEGTFDSRRVTMGFVNHGGMWGDLLLMSCLNATIVPHLPRVTGKRILVPATLLSCAIALTVFAHIQWFSAGKLTGATNHIFPSYSSGDWYRDISLSGWMHLAYMSAQLAIVFAFVSFPMPPKTVFLASAILTAHIPLANVQPGWYSTGQIWTTRNILPAAVMLLLTWLAAFLRL